MVNPHKTPTSMPVEQEERVARAIDPVWWAWADVHYDETIGHDADQRKFQIDRAKRAIAALPPAPSMEAETVKPVAWRE